MMDSVGSRNTRRARRIAGVIVGTVAIASAAAVGISAFVSRVPRPSAAVTASPRLAEGRTFIDSLRAMTARTPNAADVSLEAAVALGYAERLRLGLGTPFRLADFALNDPRLSARVRTRTAWALLDAARGGAAHIVDARALSTVIPARAGSGEQHLALITRELEEGDPRAGELTVRLAYKLATAERIISQSALPVIAQAAALVRDREIARWDVERLLEAAAVEGRDPLALLPEWRVQRRFASERPAIEVQDAEAERRALPRVQGLLDSVRAMASAGERGDSVVMARPRWRTPLLPRSAADRLASESGYLPPQGPVAVAMRTHRDLLEEALPRSVSARTWVAGLADRVSHDEALAAEHARTVWSGVHTGAVARVTLAAAVGMRGFAQEAPWFPGTAGPSADDLRRSFGFAEVKFASDVPAAWRPYYRRMLASATGDLRRVVPTARFEGLRVRFEVVPTTAPLAVHDPATRTLRLPVATVAGVLAHELAHDLDWQAARRLYARRSGYSTDYAVRARHDRVAMSVQGLTSAELIPPSEENGFRPPHDQRPAEVFARNFDWFVAMSLAREGRGNGYLTAVQDELLTGYATVSAREADGRGAESLMRLLNDVAFVAAPVRGWFLEHWGPTRTLRSYALVRELLATPGSDEDLMALAGLPDDPEPPSLFAAIRSMALPSPEEGVVCDGRGVASAERPQVALARLAAESRARGTLLAAARRLPAEGRPAWAQSALGVAPWSSEVAELAVLQLRDGFLQRLAARGVLESPFAQGTTSCF